MVDPKHDGAGKKMTLAPVPAIGAPEGGAILAGDDRGAPPCLAAALRYAAAGYAVLPVDAREKRPLVPWKEFQDRRATEAEILAWWGQWPDAGLAIVTGEVSGISVVDVDPRNGGVVEAWAGLSDVVQDTPSGGAHFVVAYDSALKKPKAGRGGDLQSDGRYVLVAPTNRGDGRGYAWRPGAQEKLLARQLPPGAAVLERLRPGRSGQSDDDIIEYSPPWVCAALSPDVEPGRQATTLARLAGYFASKNISPDIAVCLIQPHVLSWPSQSGRERWTPEDIERQVRSVYETAHRKRATATSAPEGRLLRLSDVRGEAVTWLWRDRIPFGKVAIIEGDPGQAKSTMALDIASRLSVGEPMPGESAGCDPGNTLVLSYEDGAADTIKGRVQAAGGDQSRITVYSLDHVPVIPDGLEQIEEDIRRAEAKFVIVDPLMAALAGRVDSHRDQDIRRVLQPLAALALKYGVAVLVVRHLNKNAGTKSAIYRGGGSIGITGAARAVLLAGYDPDYPNDTTRHVLAPVKMNLCAMPPTLRYTVESVQIGPGQTTVHLAWGEKADITADAILARPDVGGASALHGAEALIRTLLANGPVKAAEMEEQLRAGGIAEITWKRAKKRLRVQSRNRGGAWEWVMPPEYRVVEAEDAA